MPPQSIPADTVRAALERVLARPEYAPPELPPLQRWLGGAMRWVGARLLDLVRWLMPNLHTGDPVWQVIGKFLLAVAAVVGAIVVAWLAVAGVRAWSGRRRRAAGAGGPAGAAGPASAAEWEAAARAAAQRGAWRDAAVALYHAVLYRLSERELVRLDASKTPGDYRREVRGTDVAEPLDAFVRAFEWLAYGRGAEGADSYRALAEHAVPLGARG